MIVNKNWNSFSSDRLQDQLNGLKTRPHDSDSDLSDWEEQLNRKRRQIKKKKEQLRRIQDDGYVVQNYNASQ